MRTGVFINVLGITCAGTKAMQPGIVTRAGVR